MRVRILRGAPNTKGLDMFDVKRLDSELSMVGVIFSDIDGNSGHYMLPNTEHEDMNDLDLIRK